MSEYRVTWAIDIDAESIEDAARTAQRIQQDTRSIATVFYVAKQCSCGEFHADDIKVIDLMEKTYAH